jgi:DAPAT_plant: LL-diaminopimelate aminotransferase
VRCLTQYPLV